MGDKNLATLFQNRVYRHGDRPAIAHKAGGRWTWRTWEECGKAVEEAGRGFLSLGLQPSDRAAVFSDNRPEWVFCDLGILSVGGITVPIHATSSLAQVEFILRHSGSKIVVVGGDERLEHLLSIREKLPELRQIISIDGKGPLPYADFLQKGTSVPAATFYERLERVSSKDVSTIIYTSGTTGDPKGVVLTHANIVSNVEAAANVLPVTGDDLSLSILPLSHALERTAGFYTLMSIGTRIAYAENISKTAQNLGEVRPTILICVPRVLEKIYARVSEEISMKPGLVRFLFRKAVAKPASPLMRPLFERLFFRKIRAMLGGRIRYLISGGAALNPKVALFFRAVGVQILEGYGLTEASPVVAVNRPELNKIGTVGTPLPGVEVRIAEDGEVLVRGPGVMKGYYKNEEATRAAIGEDGFLKTGDIGTVDADGCLKLTDRKKEIIVTSGGKKVPPQALENGFKTHSLVEQACVLGDGRKYLAVLLVPNYEVLEKLARTAGFETESREKLLARPEVQEWFTAIVSEVNADLASYETIKRFALLPAPFSIEKQELTPTLKLRRKIIEEHHAAVIERLFN